MRFKTLFMLSLALFTMAILPAVAAAAIAGDSNAVLHNNITFANGVFSGHVDYAVYAPGFYDGSLSLPADKYVYCYQLFEDTSSSVNIDSFSVGLYPGITVGNMTYDPAHPVAAPGGTNPSAEIALSQTALYIFFSSNPIMPGNNSSVLLFTSDTAPAFGSGLVSGGISGGTIPLNLPTPTPNPEPASLFLFSLGIPALVRFRRRAV
jgi:hypothetical protein